MGAVGVRVRQHGSADAPVRERLRARPPSSSRGAPIDTSKAGAVRPPRDRADRRRSGPRLALHGTSRTPIIATGPRGHTPASHMGFALEPRETIGSRAISGRRTSSATAQPAVSSPCGERNGRNFCSDGPVERYSFDPARKSTPLRGPGRSRGPRSRRDAAGHPASDRTIRGRGRAPPVPFQDFSSISGLRS